MVLWVFAMIYLFCSKFVYVTIGCVETNAWGGAYSYAADGNHLLGPPGGRFIMKIAFYRRGIPIVEMRKSWDRFDGFVHKARHNFSASAMKLCLKCFALVHSTA